MGKEACEACGSELSQGCRRAGAVSGDACTTMVTASKKACIALGSADIDDSASLPMKTGGAAAESSGDESCELPSGESGSWATGDVARDEAGVMRG